MGTVCRLTSSQVWNKKKILMKLSHFSVGQITGVSKAKHIPWESYSKATVNQTGDTFAKWGSIIRDHTTHILPPLELLLIRGYQKLGNNSYSNSIFLLKENLPLYIQTSWTVVLFYDIQSIVVLGRAAPQHQGSPCSLPYLLARQTWHSWNQTSSFQWLIDPTRTLQNPFAKKKSASPTPPYLSEK